nr:MAG TPA: hypothetical protein [Caudoviricetes sp.]
MHCFRHIFGRWFMVGCICMFMIDRFGVNLISK